MNQQNIRAVTAGRQSHQPRRFRRWVRISLAGLLVIVLLVGVLFTLNGLWLASRETPLAGATRATPSDGSTAGAAPDADGDDPAEVKVLSYNIAKGFVYEGGLHFDNVQGVEERLRKMALLVRQEKPDLVFLSETIFQCHPCPLNQVEYLSREGGLPYWAFGENYNFGLPFFRIVGGNAILSRWPLCAVGNPSLSGQRPFFLTRNNRRALWCEFRLGGRPLLLAAVHNDSFDLTNNTRQARELLAYAGDRPAIIAGDFNARPDEPAIRLIHSSGRFTGKLDGPLTFPTGKPDQTIDFIFAPAEWTLVEHHVPQCDASDHLPVVSTFRRRAAGRRP